MQAMICHSIIYGAIQEDTDVWGTLTEQNSVIFHDNDVSLSFDSMISTYLSRSDYLIEMGIAV